MNTSGQRKLPEDFECGFDLPDSECSAVQKEWSQTDTHVTCWKCGVNLFPLSERDVDGETFTDDADADDDESDYVDEVTVSEAEMDNNFTPEEQRSLRAFRAIDEIKAKCRISSTQSVKQFGEFVHGNRFDIHGMYIILQENKNFFRSSALIRRLFIISVTHARYTEDYEPTLAVYEHFSYDKTRIDKMADRAFEEYTGREQPRVLMWMNLYGRKFGFAPEVVTMAIEMWDAADPVYVAAEDQVRAVVWLALTKKKMDKEKFTYSSLSKLTGFDSRVISRVSKVYAPYFE